MTSYETQVARLAAVVRTGSTKAAARELGIGPSTLKNDFTALYRTLGVQSSTGAFRALGWLKLPPEYEGGSNG